MAVFDDGTGPAVYVGGLFSISPPGRPRIRNFAKWDGQSWWPAGIGAVAEVKALASFDDGSGPALYVGTVYDYSLPSGQQLIRRWNGVSWSLVGAGVYGGAISELNVVDLGTGPALYAAGNVYSSATVSANVARWDGHAWTLLGAPLGASSTVVEGFQGFLYTNGANSRLMRFDGADWVTVPAVPSATVKALKVFDNGSGPALYVGGSIPDASCARFDGASLYPIGTFVGEIGRFAAFDDGSGTHLYAFQSNSFTDGIYKVTGNTLTLIATLIPYSSSFTSVAPSMIAENVGGVQGLLVGGPIGGSGIVASKGIIRYDGTAWRPMPPGIAPKVWALGQLGDTLFVGGQFDTAGGVAMNNIAAWNGTSMTPVGGGLHGLPRKMIAFDDGSGPALYVGGQIDQAGGVAANAITRWNGSQWQGLGSGLRYQSGQTGTVEAFTVHDDGTGPALFVAGRFDLAGATAAANIARWRNGQWSAVEGGLTGTSMYLGGAALTSYDDGTGPALYVGGDFSLANNVPVHGVARRRGTTWEDVGGGVAISNGGAYVSSFRAFDDGNGPALFAGGFFTTAGTSPSHFNARWRNGSWSELGFQLSGLILSPSGFDGESVLEHAPSPTLFVYGSGFQTYTSGGQTYNYILGWTGAGLTALGTGADATIRATLAIDDPTAPRLIAGGDFVSAGGVVSPGVAQWNSCPTCYANCDRSTIPPLLNVNDFVCFLNKFSAGSDYANCDGSTIPPVLSVLDFTCFLNKFAAGCP